MERQQIATNAEATAAQAPVRRGTLAALLAGRFLQDGEIVILLLKPSAWFVLLHSLKFAGVVMILMGLARLYDAQLPSINRYYMEAGLFLIAGRVTWSMLQWMSRLYVLTNLRILRLSGIFSVDLFDCPLRRVARTRLVYSTRERVMRLGTVEITPADHETPPAFWGMIARPREVHEQIIAAIAKSRQGNI